MQYQTWQRYESPERWASYQTQIDGVLEFAPQSCLEVGVGNHVVSDALRRLGVAVTTLDIDPALHPDLVGSVERIPAGDGSFDVALCAEVLEHLPFDAFGRSLDELARVSRRGAVVSLPHWGYTTRLILDVPGLPPFRRAWKLPWATAIRPGGEHQWEIGRRGYPLTRILGELRSRFTLRRHFLSPWMPYHHFFVLEKPDAPSKG